MSSVSRSTAFLRTISQNSCRFLHSGCRVLRRTSPPYAPSSSTKRFATTTSTSPDLGTGKSLATLLNAPRKEDLADDEEVELLSGDEARLEITERAAEKLSAISLGEKHASLALRIAVESGGCHGYQYKMELTSEHAPDDYRFSHPEHQRSTIVVDAVSLALLKGSTVDYATELIGSSFRIVENPQAKGSGCGCGVSWEAKF